MKLAFLICFHKELEICQNRFRMLRKYNPDLPIYAVFGGPENEAEMFENGLKKYVDDFYFYNPKQDPAWKWVNFDIMIGEWYAARGKDLEFDTVVSTQWDHLVLAPIKELFSELKKDEILFSGLRPAAEVEDWWYWVSKKQRKGTPAVYGYKPYITFLNYLKEKYNYTDTPVFSQPFLCMLPRTFLQPYSQIDWSIGYGEYRMPMYAQAFGIPFCKAHPLKSWWPEDPAICTPKVPDKIVESDNIPPYAERTLTTARIPLPLKEILKLSKGKDGIKLFHPYYRIYPVDWMDWARLLRDKILNRHQ